MNHLAQYIGNGQVEIVPQPMPTCPPGGLLVRTEACGLCSGELMSWYMDQKMPHVLGHEVAGVVIESQDDRFPAGSRVFPHHHAPCMECEMCLTERFVHCATWKKTKLRPGGMAEYFTVDPENLTDTHVLNDLRAIDAALIEPLGCVEKALLMGGPGPYAVIGLGFMGLLHMLSLPDPVSYDVAASRRQHALNLGLDARDPADTSPARTVFVCPGSQAAFDFALKIIEPGGTIVMFAPLPPSGPPLPSEGEGVGGESKSTSALHVPQAVYFKDIAIKHAYSAAPPDSLAAIARLRTGTIRAEQVVSRFINLDQLPEAYGQMKRGEILKPMVLFGSGN
jgi:L-iditol 2-dehydrogenase